VDILRTACLEAFRRACIFCAPPRPSSRGEVFSQSLVGQRRGVQNDGESRHHWLEAARGSSTSLPPHGAGAARRLAHEGGRGGLTRLPPPSTCPARAGSPPAPGTPPLGAGGRGRAATPTASAPPPSTGPPTMPCGLCRGLEPASVHKAKRYRKLVPQLFAGDEPSLTGDLDPKVNLSAAVSRHGGQRSAHRPTVRGPGRDTQGPPAVLGPPRICAPEGPWPRKCGISRSIHARVDR